MPVQIVWFKKDLRVEDHEPLVRASERGTVLPLFIYEPEQLSHPEFRGHHLTYLNECLRALTDELAGLGTGLVIRRGEATQVLADLRRETDFAAVWSHEETGNWVGYQRDRRVRAWCRAAGVACHELPQNGVVRRMKNRDGWAATWEERLGHAPLAAPPALASVGLQVQSLGVLDHAALGVPANAKVIPAGGRQAALGTLESFLSARGVNYQQDMSSPLTALEGCSRLSAPLAFGTVSLREVVHATRRRLAAVKGDVDADLRWLRSLRAFESRLHWHCHFMQRLESEPEMEFRNLNRAFDDLRPDWNQEFFERWREGETGYPLQDACMRSLRATGWLNFRMRAMTVSFASQLLWLHWRTPGEYLASQWLDNEPGIHWSQMQMQSSTVGINRVRIYNPVKQSRDQDPAGEFIRRWVPELADVPADFIHEPWTWSGAGRLRYPAPVVDAARAMRAAKARIDSVRQTEFFAQEAERVYVLHGSRKKAVVRAERRERGLPERSARVPRKKGPVQVQSVPGLFDLRRSPIIPAGLPHDWQAALLEAFSAPSFHDLTEFLKIERRDHTVYPPAPDVFNALRLTPLSQVKVLILGQDPYHGPGQANGLSFSVKRGVDVPPSLRNIYRELNTDLPDVTVPQHGDLSAWAAQGVLLLNAVLTVRRGLANSHQGRGWEEVTDAVIRAVNARPGRTVFVLWGAYARRKARLVTGEQHVVIESAHPSPLSAERFFGSRPFSRVNTALAEAGVDGVDWQLPA